MMWCDAIIIVYSVTDRSSFAEAQRLKITSKMVRRELKMSTVSRMSASKIKICFYAGGYHDIIQGYHEITICIMTIIDEYFLRIFFLDTIVLCCK